MVDGGRPTNSWVIVLSLIFASVLAIVPIPQWLELWRPDWVSLVLIYWVMALPHRVGMVIGWSVGLLVDVLKGTLLGLNAGVFTLFAYIALTLYQRLRMFTPLQQSVTIMMLVATGQLIVFWVQTATGQNTADNLTFIVCAFTSALMWPLVFVGLRFCRRTFHVT
ncbi:MAG TPA: rod shape-determining protein MreD [Candidatus Acidoferrum sp.]|nr:rod shape-determining protein MreD [Candidatus Acidoferrum sp.]